MIPTSTSSTTEDSESFQFLKEGDSDDPLSLISSNVTIVEEFGESGPFSILEAPNGQRLYVLGPVFTSQEEGEAFLEFFEQAAGISFAEFYAPIFEAYKKFMAEEAELENAHPVSSSE